MSINTLLRFSILSPLLFLYSCIDYQTDVFSISCENDCGVVNGFIVTGDGTIPATDLELEIIWDKTTILGGGIIRTKTKTITDSEGFYEAKVRVRPEEIEEGYFLVRILSGEEYFICNPQDKYHEFPVFDLTNDTTISIDYGIPYKASLKINSSGASNMGDEDIFTAFVSSPTGIDFQSGCIEWVSWNNQTPDEEYLINVAAEQPIVIETRSTREGQSTIRTYDTLFFERNQQLEYTAVFE